jgi:hypothetical protein
MNNETKQTAVEQLVSELHRRILIIESEPNGIVRTTMIDNFLVDIEEFKEMDKEHIMNAYMIGALLENISIEAAEHYYNETYGGNK